MSSSPRLRRRGLPVALLALAFAGAACSKDAGETPATAGAGADEPSAAPTAPAAGQPAPATTPGQPATAAPGAAADPAQRVLTPEEVPAVVARIDGNDVTREDLLTRASEARGALAQRGLPPPQLTYGFLREVLNDVVGSRLLARDLQGKGSAATDAEVEAKIAEIRRGFASDEEFDKALVGRGFDRARLRRDVAESLTVNKWVAGSVIPSVAVTEAEARAFYESNPDKMVEPEKVHARHILVRVERDATSEAKAAQRQKVDAARARIAGGADFATVAQEVSDDKGSAARGGDLGFFYRGQMVPAFENAAFSLEPKKLSEPVETPFGFHLIEVLEKQPESKLAFEQVRERIESVLKQRQLEQKVKAQVNALAAQAKIEILL